MHGPGYIKKNWVPLVQKDSFFLYFVVFTLQHDVPLLAVSVLVLQAGVRMLRHLCPCSASLCTHDVLFLRSMYQWRYVFYFSTFSRDTFFLFYRRTLCTTVVVCLCSEVGCSQDMCSCSAGRCSRSSIMCSCSAVGCSHKNTCSYSIGLCSRDVFFLLQANVPRDNLSS
jgi:hypothetical protein